MLKLPLKFKQKSKNRIDHFFCIDLGSYSIKCGVFKVDTEKQNQLRLVGLYEEKVEPGVISAGNIIDLEKAIIHLDEALFKASEGIEEKIDHAIVGFGSDLAINLVTTAKINRTSDVKISSKEIKEIYNKINESSFEKAYNLLYKKTGEEDQTLECTASTIVYAKCDNQKVTKIIDVNCKTLEIAIYSSYVTKNYLDSVSKVFKKLKLDVMAIVPNSYAVVESMKKNIDNFREGVLIDLGHNTTQINVVFEGGIVESNSISFGGAQFTQSITNKTGLNLIEAERKKLDYVYENLLESEQSMVEDLLRQSIQLWLSSLEVVFSEFNGVKTFPSDIYLIGSSTNLPLVINSLKNEPWTKAIPFKIPPEFKKLTHNHIKHVIDETGKASLNQFICCLCLSIIYFESIISEND